MRLLFQQHPPSRPLLLLDSYLIDLLVLVKLSRQVPAILRSLHALVRSWVTSVPSQFKTDLFRRAYAPCDEHCCGGPRSYHHLWNGNRRVCIRRSIPGCTCFWSPDLLPIPMPIRLVPGAGVTSHKKSELRPHQMARIARCRVHLGQKSELRPHQMARMSEVPA